MQFLLANKSFSMWEGLYFISPASLFFLFVAMCLEFQDMVDKDAWGMVKGQPHLVRFSRLSRLFHQFVFVGGYQSRRIVDVESFIHVSIGFVNFIRHGGISRRRYGRRSDRVRHRLSRLFWYNFAKIAQKEQEAREKEAVEKEPLLASNEEKSAA